LTLEAPTAATGSARSEAAGGDSCAQGHGSFPTAGAWVEAGGDAERDAAHAGVVRVVGGRAALRRGGRLLVLLPRLLVALLVAIRLLDGGEYETASVH
jgi:hypothetical protein